MLFKTTIPLRFWSKVYAAPCGCWLWTGAKASTGYGNFMVSKRPPRWQKAHRYLYEQLCGPIADELVMDHLCRTPLCVSLFHLEPVTPKVNINRGVGHGKETHCPHGHEYSTENTYRDRKNRRYCRACRRQRDPDIEQRRKGVLMALVGDNRDEWPTRPVPTTST